MQSVCVAMRRPQLWQLLRQRLLLLPLLLVVCFVFFFFVSFAVFEQHSGKCCNFALFTLCFIFNLFYGRLDVSAPTLRVCECHSFAHMPQCTATATTTTWAKVLGHIKTKTQPLEPETKLSWPSDLFTDTFAAPTKGRNKKKWNKKSFLARKIKTKSTKRRKRKRNENKMRQSWSCS